MGWISPVLCVPPTKATKAPKSSAAERTRLWRLANAEHAKAYKKAYLKKNAERVRQWFRDYRKARKAAGNPITPKRRSREDG